MSDLPGHEPSSLHRLVTDDENLKAALQRVANVGCSLLSKCEAASVTIIERGRPVTAGATSAAAMAMDVAQYDADDGPCLHAARTGRSVLVDDVSTESRWAAFRDAAIEHRLSSSLSMPLKLGGDTCGGLNVYGASAGAFTDEDQRLAADFAAQATIEVANAQSYWAALDATQNLTVALQRRAVIEQAKGVLIGELGLSDDDAFDVLRRRSQAANRKLRDVAIDIVDAARRPRPT